MRCRIVVVFILALAFLFTTVSAAADRGPSTPEERRLFVELTAFLEQEPLSAKAKEVRTYLFAWLSAVPDISVVVCMEPINLIMAAEYDQQHKAAFMIQSMFGQATYLIQHPDTTGDTLATQLAGIESMLRTYEAMVTQGAAHLPFLDELLEKRQTGQLENWAGDQIASCKI